MKKTFLSLIILFSSMVLLANNNTFFLKREFVYKGDTLRYRVMYPENYDQTKKYPIVLFLHGAGERGDDNEKQLTHGSYLFTDSANRKNYPFIVIFPQCPKNDYWVNLDKNGSERITFLEKPEITKPLQLVKSLMDYFIKNEGVDKNRIYVMGLSMGGMGTYELICRYPTYFTAAVPICGGVYEPRLKKVRKMPIRIFHGSDDSVVKKDFSQNAYIELKAEGAEDVEYIEFPGVGHDSWTKAFAYPDFLSWLYSKSKKKN